MKNRVTRQSRYSCWKTTTFRAKCTHFSSIVSHSTICDQRPITPAARLYVPTLKPAPETKLEKELFINMNTRKQQPKGFKQCWRLRERVSYDENKPGVCFECRKADALRGEELDDKAKERVRKVWRGKVRKYEDMVKKEKALVREEV